MNGMKSLFVLMLAMVSIFTVVGLSACVPPGPTVSPTSPVIESRTVGPGTPTTTYTIPTTKPTTPPTPPQSMLQLAFAGNRNGKYALFLINIDGSGEKQITTAGDYTSPTWSPDGTLIALQDAASGGEAGLGVMNLTDGSIKGIFRGSQPDFSPYGNLVICYSPGSGITAFNLGGVKTSIFKSMQIYWRNPRFSPDASMIAFDDSIPFKPTVTPTTTSSGNLGGKGITSPDQFQGSGPSGNFVRVICVANFDGTNRRQLSAGKDKYDDTYPAWAPDGKRIAFMSNRTGQNQIYVMNADGSAQTRITNDNFENHDPAWSPDGDYIAYVSDHAGISELCIIRPDGTGRTRINRVNELVKAPAWRPLPGHGLGVPPTLPTSSTSPVTTTTPVTTAPSTTGRLIISASGTNGPYSIYVNGGMVGKDSATLNLAPESYRVTIYNSKGTVIKDENSTVIAGKDSIVRVSGAG